MPAVSPVPVYPPAMSTAGSSMRAGILLLLVAASVLLLAPSKAQAKPSLLFLGDSLTEGYYAPRGFADILLARYPGQKLGFAGGRTTQVVLPLPPADIAVVELGTNDADYWTPTRPATFGRAYNTVLAALRAANPRVRLVCLGVWKQEKSRATYDRIIKYVGKRYRAVFASLDRVADDRRNCGPAGDMEPQGVSDGWHPNARGHRAIADLLSPILRRIAANLR
jgi:lysophospholipase L1-like esterase